MANSVQDLELFMKAVADLKPWKYDSSCPDIPWKSAVSYTDGEKLTIGILPEASEYPLHPPVARAIDNAAIALENAGHKVLRLSQQDCPDITKAARIAFQIFGIGGADFKALEKQLGEPLVPSVWRAINPFSDGKFVVSTELDAFQQLAMLHTAMDEYAESWKDAWLRHNLDVMIAPGSQHTAVPHDNYGMNTYTVIWNVLNVSVDRAD